MDQIKIGQFIAQLRKSKNMTQAQMAEKLGVSNKSVSRWETGKNMPDVSLFIPICNLLDISVNELIIGEIIKEDVAEKTNEIIVDTIDKSNKRINIARVICYLSVFIAHIGLSVSISLTATPSDAMAVPLAGILISGVTAIIIGMLDIKFLYKMLYIPLSLIIFFSCQLIYSYNIDGEFFIIYSLAILVIQLALLLVTGGVMILIRKCISKSKEKQKSA